MPTKGYSGLGVRSKSSARGTQYGHKRGKERQKKKREDKLQQARVKEALAETRAEQQALERRIAAEAQAPATGPAPGAEFTRKEKERQAAEEAEAARLAAIPPPKPPLAQQVRLVESRPYKARAVGQPEVLGETRSIKVDPEVWSYVLEAGVDPRCVQVISETEIICHNRPRCW